MTDFTLVIVAIAGGFTSLGAIAATVYHYKRIAIEKQRSAEMKVYYEKLLAIEREKVAVEKEKLARRNGA